MTTMNQLVKKGRGNKVRKPKSPVLRVGLNSIQKKKTIHYVIYELSFNYIIILSLLNITYSNHF